MATLDDQAEAAEALHRAAALKFRKPQLQPIGYCYYCNEPVKGIFCDIECSKSYEHEQKLLRQKGN